jgi:hypothetical protein
MQITERLSISPLGDADGDEPAKSRLIIDGSACETVVAGSCFEAALEGEGFYLLFLTNGNPFEDFLNIHMLDKQGSVVDSCTLGAPYSTGSFTGLKLLGEKLISFRFIGGTVWQLKVFPKWRWRMPFVSEHFGVWRRHLLKFHFQLRGNPVAQK